MNDFGDETLKEMIENRPKFPKRVMITAGMPYGNKALHCGHIGGVFVHADVFSRFMRDRIGKENVIFVSGTDCFGSAIMEGYRKLKQTSGFSGDIEDYVEGNHNIQKNTLDRYEIDLDFFGASALKPAKDIHAEMTRNIFEVLKEKKVLKKMRTLQFYDESKHTFLNGRQVVGKCPFENCISEKAYADCCDLGHQYMPKELISPISVLSGTRPVLRETENWYVNLEDDKELLTKWVDFLEKNTVTRPYVIKEIREFLKEPGIYIQNKYKEKLGIIKAKLPPFSKVEEGKSSMLIYFTNLKDREKACEILTDNEIRYRTDKTLVPFRLTGNIPWGIPVPNEKDMTFRQWPESLWAPLSFTKTYLKYNKRKAGNWKDWWCSRDCKIYQFIGEDNIYFYGPAQHAIWLSMQRGNKTLDVPNGELQLSTLVVNKHLLFLNKKASSSSKTKPPMADDLLKYYTAEQLRFHFLGLNLGSTSANFMPKRFNPDAKEKENDPVLKEGNLLTNVYNKILRTVIYTTQKYFDGIVPYGKVDDDVIKKSLKLILKVEDLILKTRFHIVTYELDTYIRDINKTWVKNVDVKNLDALKKLVINTLYMCKVAMVLLHPIAPKSTENLAKFLKLDPSVFSWDGIDKPIYDFVLDKDNYKPEFLKSRQDFFKKHPSQFQDKN